MALLDLRKTTILPETSCPTCGQSLNATTGAGDPMGDGLSLSLCFYCGEFLAFTENLGLRKLSKEETLALPDDVQQLLFDLREQVLRLVQEREAKSGKHSCGQNAARGQRQS